MNMVDKDTTTTTTTMIQQQPQQQPQKPPKPTFWQALRQYIRHLNDTGCYCELSSSKGFVIYYADNTVLAGGFEQTWVAVVRWMKAHHIYDIPDSRKQKENVVHDVWAGLPLVSGVILRPDVAEPMVPGQHGDWLRNLWKPYSYSTAPQAHQRVDLVMPYLMLVEFLLPDPIERKIVLQFYAHALRPDTAADKPSFGLLFTGPEGDGKSFTFDTVLTLVLGEGRVHHAQQGVNALGTALETACYYDKALCICDDFDDANTATVERLKCVITRTVCQFKRLYQDVQQAPIYTRHIFIGNSHNPIYFGSGTDRRYFAPAYCPEKDPAMIQLIDDYHKLLKADPLYRDAWYWFMTTQVDVSDFNPHVLVETDNHRRMVSGCVTDVQSQFKAMLDELKPDLVTKYWYQHHLIKMFGDDVSNATVDKHWKAISGYLRDGEGWQQVQFRLPGQTASRGSRIRGFVRPGVTDATIKAMLAALDPADLEVYTLSSLGDKGWYAS